MHVQKNNQVLPFSQMGYHIIFLSLSGLPRVTQSVKRKIRSYIVHLGKCHEFKINAKLFFFFLFFFLFFKFYFIFKLYIIVLVLTNIKMNQNCF